MTINPLFTIGQTAYLKTDPEQLEHIVIAYVVNANGLIYEIMFNNEASLHYALEITEQPNQLKALGITANEERN